MWLLLYYPTRYCFDDIQNEPKYQQVGADFVEKAVYSLQKI
jgi:hypothetical protein